MPIYTNIKKTCKQKGISVTKLEADLGFARSTIYKWDTHQPGIGKDIEFITRIQVNGEKRELTKEEASELILRRVKEALEGMNYEKTA